MNHRQRLEACISGNEVDRPPVALWRHFPVDDSNAVELSNPSSLFKTHTILTLSKSLLLHHFVSVTMA